MSTTGSSKRMRLRRPDRCAVCDRELAVGDEAIWHGVLRPATCLGCDPADIRVEEGSPGTSAIREYERRHLAREQHAREKLGGLGVFLAKVIDEPQSTTAWQQGGRGEVRSGERLDRHLREHGVRMLQLIDGVERQIGYVRSALRRLDPQDEIEIRGALCFPNPDGLPMFSQLSVRGIIIDGPKPVAKLARRPGALDAQDVERIWVHLGCSLPLA